MPFMEHRIQKVNLQRCRSNSYLESLIFIMSLLSFTSNVSILTANHFLSHLKQNNHSVRPLMCLKSSLKAVRIMVLIHKTKRKKIARL